MFDMTPMMKRYLKRLLFRITVFLSIFLFYLRDKQKLWLIVTDPIYMGVSPIRFVWLIFMVIMLLR